MQSESDTFEFLVRAQLICGSGKTDTYYAFDKESKQVVFVKGPFKSKNEVELTLKIIEAKRYFSPVLQVKAEVKILIPNLLTTPLGVRQKLDKSKAYPFLVFTDLCGFMSRDEQIPIKTKSSKMWPETEVVDWNKVDVSEVCKEDLKDDTICKEYILALLFKYIFGINDIANRNFMVNRQTKNVYGVDEDVIDKTFTFNRLALAIKLEITNNWDRLNIDSVLVEWKESIQTNKQALADLFSEKFVENLEKRIGQIRKFMFLNNTQYF